MEVNSSYVVETRWSVGEIRFVEAAFHRFEEAFDLYEAVIQCFEAAFRYSEAVFHCSQVESHYFVEAHSVAYY